MSVTRALSSVDNSSCSGGVGSNHSRHDPVMTRLRYKGTTLYLNRCCFVADLRDRKDAFIIQRAEERAVEEEFLETSTTLDVSIEYHVPFEHSLWMVGSVRELGNWDPPKGVELNWHEGDIWKCTIVVKRHEVSKLEYKYITRYEHCITWEEGKNHNILPGRPCENITIRDQWGFPGFNYS